MSKFDIKVVFRFLKSNFGLQLNLRFSVKLNLKSNLKSNSNFVIDRSSYITVIDCRLKFNTFLYDQSSRVNDQCSSQTIKIIFQTFFFSILSVGKFHFCNTYVKNITLRRRKTVQFLFCTERLFLYPLICESFCAPCTIPRACTFCTKQWSDKG